MVFIACQQPINIRGWFFRCRNFNILVPLVVSSCAGYTYFNMTLEKLLITIEKNRPNTDLALVRLAYEFAERAHQGQKRMSGEAYITHPLATAMRLAEWRLDEPTIIAGLLHDVPEDTPVTAAQIKKEFGAEIAQLVVGVTKLSKVRYRGMQRYIENLRKMFVAMAEDVRVMLIKFADRLHNLETISTLPPGKQRRIALETLEIYAPIANRLGMGDIKGRLEDLAFAVIDPSAEAATRQLMAEHLPSVGRELEQAIRELRADMAAENIPIISIHGREKRLYSLYKKLQRPGYDGDIEKIYDLMALRLVVQNMSDCYAALGLIHKCWRPVPGRFKDYIAQPKPNGYQSLHTTVFGPGGRPLEIQIRDLVMHQSAEFGIAAHWHYEEAGKPDRGSVVPEEKLLWVSELSRWHKEIEDDEQFLETLKIDAFQNRIFVFTPKGDVIDLPESSTPVDFAYHVHTDLGDHTSGARVNGRLVELATELKSGDVVEIVVEKNRKAPNRDWLDFVKTHLARTHIRRALREHE